MAVKLSFYDHTSLYICMHSGSMVSSSMKKCRYGIPFHTVPLSGLSMIIPVVLPW